MKVSLLDELDEELLESAATANDESPYQSTLSLYEREHVDEQ